MRLSFLAIHLSWIFVCLIGSGAKAQSPADEPLSEHAAPLSVLTDVNAAPSLKEVLGQLQDKKNSKKRPVAGQNQSQLNGTANLQDSTIESELSADHPLKSLVENAEIFARAEHSEAERVDVSLTPVDRRLRLKRCDEALSYAWTSSTKRMGNTNITARCDGSAPWKVLVRAKVHVFHNIPVLSVPVDKGDILTDDLVTARLLDVSVLRSETIRTIDKVVGYQFKRRVAAGREISSSVLAAPKVVTKGDSVLIIASNQILDVQMKGTALSGGEVGRKIKVRSDSSGRVIQTWIKGPGQVVVSP